MNVESRPVANPEIHEQFDTVNYFNFTNEMVKATNDYLALGNKEKEQLNWYVLQIYKGIASGLFAKMRNEGSVLVARHLARERGISQTLSPRQDAFLANFDAKHNL